MLAKRPVNVDMKSEAVLQSAAGVSAGEMRVTKRTAVGMGLAVLAAVAVSVKGKLVKFQLRPDPLAR